MSTQRRPLVSIVLPAYRVQAHLRECLDSIVGQSFTDFEVIAVDDCSPDACGAIMDEYAERDERVRVVHLEQNVGLGEGRNVGLDAATGEYVMFVDSDDMLAEGALWAIHERVEETHPDVLFFDYARTYWWGKEQRNVYHDLFREPPPPDTFTLAQRPSVLNIMMTAWNKAFRRQYLLDLGLRFARGYYEDLNVTYPVLMAAERISLLDRVCYFYRQRRAGGAITRTTSDKHFAAFDQYEQIFAFMDARGPSVDGFRPMMFERMMWHLFIILGRGDRVPPRRRRDFFHRMAEVYQRFVPAGFSPPPGLEGVKYRLVQKNSYWRFAALKVLNMTLQRAGRLRRVGIRVARRRLGQVRTWGLRACYWVWRLLPMNPNLAVFAAYWYRGYTCSPRAVYEAMRSLAPNVRGVWVVRKDATEGWPDGVDYVVPNTFAYYRALARARYLVNNVNFPNDYVKRRGSVLVQTHHGTPLKTMGMDLARYPTGAAGMDMDALAERSRNWDFSVTSNRHSTEAWSRAYPFGYETLEYGYPRNDRYVTATAEDVARVRKELGIAPGRVAILYAPTHRDYEKGFRPHLDFDRVIRALGSDYVLLMRAHYWLNAQQKLAQLEEDGLLVDVSAYPSVEDLALASDVLVTDYSSIMFDYANLDRPIVAHVPDYETYHTVRGTYFDLLAVPPGAVARTDDQLIEVFRSGAWRDEHASRARALFRERFCEFDDGRAAERVVRRAILGETDVPLPVPLSERTPAPAPSAVDRNGAALS